MFLRLFPLEADVPSRYQRACLRPRQVQVSAQRLLFQGGLAIHLIGTCTMLPSIPELSNLVLRVLFPKMPSLITSKAEIMSHLLVFLGDTGIHLRCLWGQGKMLRLWPLWIHVHQKLRHRFRGFKESLVTAVRRALWQ